MKLLENAQQDDISGKTETTRGNEGTSSALEILTNGTKLKTLQSSLLQTETWDLNPAAQAGFFAS